MKAPGNLWGLLRIVALAGASIFSGCVRSVTSVAYDYDIVSVPFYIEMAKGLRIDEVIHGPKAVQVHVCDTASLASTLSSRPRPLVEAPEGCQDLRLVVSWRTEAGRDTMGFGSIYMVVDGKCYKADTTLLRRVSQHLPTDHQEAVEKHIEVQRNWGAW